MSESSEGNSTQGLATQQTPLEKEQQQRLQKWLRNIPDDPSLLLRNKMYIESQQRNAESNQQNSSEQIW